MSNRELCRSARIPYIPPFAQIARDATRYRARPIGPQGWIAIGLALGALAIGVVAAFMVGA